MDYGRKGIPRPALISRIQPFHPPCAPAVHPNAPIRAHQARESANSSARPIAHALHWRPVTRRAHAIAFCDTSVVRAPGEKCRGQLDDNRSAGPHRASVARFAGLPARHRAGNRGDDRRPGGDTPGARRLGTSTGCDPHRPGLSGLPGPAGGGAVAGRTARPGLSVGGPHPQRPAARAAPGLRGGRPRLYRQVPAGGRSLRGHAQTGRGRAAYRRVTCLQPVTGGRHALIPPGIERALPGRERGNRHGYRGTAASHPGDGPQLPRRRHSEVRRAQSGGRHLTQGTVRNYLAAAIRKSGARNRVDAIRRAKEAGWI